MPLHEYRCPECEGTFQSFEPVGEDLTGYKCPTCGDGRLERATKAAGGLRPGQEDIT